MSQEKQIDVIDRNELLNTIRDMFRMNFEVPCYSEDRIVQQTVTKIREAIRKQESASGYRKQSEGHWMTNHCTNGGRSSKGRTIIYKTYTCDICGYSNGRRKTNFCPNCGAKMKGGAE